MQTWLFDEADNKISSGGTIAQLTPKAAAVLGCILRRKGQIVSKEDILEEVWPDLHVTEDLIREYIFDIRAALGDDARNPSYIETLRGRGFRVIGDISFAEPGETASEMEILGNQTRKPAIAILRPVTIDGDPQSAGFGENLAGLIISGLVAHRNIAVVSRQSSFGVDPSNDLREVAIQLSADYLLESSVELSNHMVRATVQLVEGRTGRNVWAQRFEVPNLSRSSASGILANKVVNALSGWHGELHLAELKIISRKSSGTLSAFEHFIRGCDLELKFDTNSVRRSLDHLDKSLELDPDFARCWVVKSIMLQWSYDIFAAKDQNILESSAQAMTRAYMLDPGDPLTLSLIALQRAREGDHSGAKNALDQAVTGCVDDADACVCVATALCVLSGEFEKSNEMFATATKINVYPPGWYRFIEARIAFYFEEYERSIAASRSGPQRVSAIIYRCLSQAMMGQIEAAKISYKDLLERYPGFDFDFYADYFPIANTDAREQYQRAVQRLLQDQSPSA